MPDPVLSVRQPWAWLIVHGYKDIENRNWPARFRGRFWVHAAQGMTRAEYWDALKFSVSCGVPQVQFPRMDELQRGAIVGSADLVDCVEHHQSRWFVGRFGFILRCGQTCEPRPLKGQLGFFQEKGA